MKENPITFKPIKPSKIRTRKDYETNWKMCKEIERLYKAERQNIWLNEYVLWTNLTKWNQN